MMIYCYQPSITVPPDPLSAYYEFQNPGVS